MELKVNKSFRWDGKLSEKAVLICQMFGLSADTLRQRSINFHCRLDIKKGDVVYITGPSGSGKSVLLSEIEKQIRPDERINLSQLELPKQEFVIDCICRQASLSGDGGLIESLKILNTAGLNDVFCVLNRPALLSDGQKWRFRLAMALCANKKFIIADEFCSELDRITAAVISYNVRRFASKYGTVFLLASCQDDVLSDLQPDVLVVKDLSGGCEVIYKEISTECRAEDKGGKSLKGEKVPEVRKAGNLQRGIGRRKGCIAGCGVVKFGSDFRKK